MSDMIERLETPRDTTLPKDTETCGMCHIGVSVIVHHAERGIICVGCANALMLAASKAEELNENEDDGN